MKPLLFISHKHADRTIATAFAKVIKDRSLNELEVFQSSDWKSKGPKFGKRLKEELHKSLDRCDVLILVYTSIDHDWSYCMYECGVATDPKSPNTKVVVLQCGKDSPAMYDDTLIVNAKAKEDLLRLFKDIYLDPEFFPSLNGVAYKKDVSEQQIEAAATELYNELQKVLPQESTYIKQWTAWPYLTIALQQDQMTAINNTPLEDRFNQAYKIILNGGKIVESHPRVSQLFGLADISPETKFSDIVNKWNEKFQSTNPPWFKSICEQIVNSARKETTVIKPTGIRVYDGDRKYTPVVNTIKELALEKSLLFEICFFDLHDPKGIPVTEKMIGLDEMDVVNIGKRSLENIYLIEILKNANHSGRNRFPILSDENVPMYVVHRSMIDRFVARASYSTPATPITELTLKDLLKDEEFVNFFENSFAVASKDSSIWDAKVLLTTKPSCSDVFITPTGIEDEPIIGWLTNTQLVREVPFS